MNELTLEEVIDKIDSYLTEAGATRKYLSPDDQKKYDENQKKLNDLIAESKKIAKGLWKANKDQETLEKKYEKFRNMPGFKYGKLKDIEGELERNETYRQSLKKELDSYQDDIIQLTHANQSLKHKVEDDIDDKNRIKERDDKYYNKSSTKGVGLEITNKHFKNGKPIANWEYRPSDRTLKKESTDDIDNDLNSLKLRVYEAYDEGIITESDKDLMLEYLNIDNYEEVKESFYDYINE